MSALSREQRRALIASAIETVTGIINRGEQPIIVAVTPAGPQVYSPYEEDVALRILKLVHDQIDWDALSDPPADYLAALGELQ